jgi:hypothetical protein
VTTQGIILYESLKQKKAIENYDKVNLGFEECLKIEGKNATIHSGIRQKITWP